MKDTFEDGAKDMLKAVTDWKNQAKPPKVYVFGKRVHHGALCTGLAILGWLCDSDYLKGAGIIGALDDIQDVEHWLDYESGGDSNSLVSFDSASV